MRAKQFLVWGAIPANLKSLQSNTRWVKDLEEGGDDGKLYFSLLFGDPTELLGPWQEFEFLRKYKFFL